MEDQADPPRACVPQGEDHPDSLSGHEDEVVFRLNMKMAYSRTICISKKGFNIDIQETIEIMKANGYRDIDTIQTVPGHRYEICLKSEDTKTKIIENGFNYRNRNWRVFDAQQELVNVVICGAPPEISNEELLENMGQFGKIKGYFTRMDKTKQIKTGIRVFQFTEITKIIPDFIRIEGTKKNLKINYNKNMRFFSVELQQQILAGETKITKPTRREEIKTEQINWQNKKEMKRKIVTTETEQESDRDTDFRVVKNQNQLRRERKRRYQPRYNTEKEDCKYDVNL